MSHLAKNITRLCHAYIKLSDKFQKLDVDYMTLRSKVVPLIKALKVYKQLVEQLSEERQLLKENLQEITQKYEELKPFEIFLEPEFQAILNEAEEQIDLVDTTLNEIESDRDPDLSDVEKALLLEYENDPDKFGALINITLLNPSENSSVQEKALQSM
jgi:predicted  nucleic acid-binding Zn-ribbon protein